jgi:hypothetical protein
MPSETTENAVQALPAIIGAVVYLDLLRMSIMVDLHTPMMCGCIASL